MNIESFLQKNLPNLDAINDVEDLVTLRGDCKQLRDGFQLLASYCEAKAAAISYRKKGDINLAIKLEKHCDTIFKQLPEWARW